jgi:hypothetical protein
MRAIRRIFGRSRLANPAKGTYLILDKVPGMDFE